MKRLRHLALCLLLALSMATSAFATEVPESFVTENLNGQQRLVKTYTLAPEIDPDTLKEPSFEYDGFTYTWAYTTKAEHPFLETKDAVKTVTVETGKNDLGLILAALAPSIEYDDGVFAGELMLDHTTLKTEAAGYATKYSKTTETKVIPSLDRNDMSYVPATTVKNGKALSLTNVDWQVTGTALVGESLVPSQYQAVATYSATNSYQAATGYVTTAEYHGKVTSEGVESITYTVVFTGTAIQSKKSGGHGLISDHLIMGAVMLLAVLLVGLLIFLFLNRKNVYVYIPGDTPRDYRLVAKFRMKPEKPEIDISNVDTQSSYIVAVEIKRSLAKKLVNKIVSIHHENGTQRYMIVQDKHDDWQEFILKGGPDSCSEEYGTEV